MELGDRARLIADFVAQNSESATLLREKVISKESRETPWIKCRNFIMIRTCATNSGQKIFTHLLGIRHTNSARIFSFPKLEINCPGIPSYYWLNTRRHLDFVSVQKLQIQVMPNAGFGWCQNVVVTVHDPTDWAPNATLILSLFRNSKFRWCQMQISMGIRVMPKCSGDSSWSYWLNTQRHLDFVPVQKLQIQVMSNADSNGDSGDAKM